MNVFNNAEGILRETEEGEAFRIGRLKINFSTLQIKEKSADILFNYNIEARFDFQTALAFEEFIEKRDLKHVTIEQIQEFLELQTKKLEQSAHQAERKPNTDRPSQRDNNRDGQASINVFSKSDRKSICKFCKKNHESKKCKTYLDLSLAKRWNKVKSLKICCFLHPYDASKPCRKDSGCTIKGCNKKHDSSLHFEEKASKNVTVANG